MTARPTARPPALTAFTSRGLQNGETVGTVTASTVAACQLSASPYAVRPSAATGGTFNAGNYTITYANGTLTVTPAALTITANNGSKIYGQTPASTAFTASGLRNGETIGSVTEASTGTAAATSVWAARMQSFRALPPAARSARATTTSLMVTAA